MWDPWRALRQLVHVRLRWADLPEDVLGMTDFSTATITLTTGMTQAERRCVIDHEIEHLRRGPVPPWLQAREERVIDRICAHRMIAFDALAEAMVWAGDLDELAEELWVDVATVTARLQHLTDDERLELRRRLEAGQLTLP